MSLLENALHNPDLDAAIRPIMVGLDIRTGDVAGQVLRANLWRDTSPDGRALLLRDWLIAEVANASVDNISVNVYHIEDGKQPFLMYSEAPLFDVLGDAKDDAAEIAAKLRAHKFAMIGGGAAPLIRLELPR